MWVSWLDIGLKGESQVEWIIKRILTLHIFASFLFTDASELASDLKSIFQIVFLLFFQEFIKLVVELVYKFKEKFLNVIFSTMKYAW